MPRKMEEKKIVLVHVDKASVSLPAAVKTINKDDQYCAMHYVWTQHIY